MLNFLTHSTGISWEACDVRQQDPAKYIILKASVSLVSVATSLLQGFLAVLIKVFMFGSISKDFMQAGFGYLPST